MIARALLLSLILALQGCITHTTNLLPNPGLEEVSEKNIPAHWIGIKMWGAPAKWSSDDAVSHGGRRSFRIAATQPTQAWLRSESIPVAPGELVHASAYLKMQNVPP